MEAWEKVLINDTGFLNSTHGKLGCVTCHGGVSTTDDKEAAHAGLVRDPAPEKACSTCHADVVKTFASSLHWTLSGFKIVLTQRGGDLSNPKLAEAYKLHCASCHASCGQCHISRPAFTGGGLIDSHKFKKVASQADTCGACHGGRIVPEYMGELKGIPGDVHFVKGDMPCIKCHTKADFHGNGTISETRYQGAPKPDCLDCHPKAVPGKSDILQHNVHNQKLSCQVCHSAGSYKSCSNCHVGKDEKGLPYRGSDDARLTFKIGLNPEKSPARPWDYVLLRHVPATANMFDFYGKDLLTHFNDVPTWKYTTPHNIQRKTPQNANCESCHANESLFLRLQDIDPSEVKANERVIVTKLPPRRVGKP